MFSTSTLTAEPYQCDFVIADDPIDSWYFQVRRGNGEYIDRFWRFDDAMDAVRELVNGQPWPTKAWRFVDGDYLPIEL